MKLRLFVMAALAGLAIATTASAAEPAVGVYKCTTPFEPKIPLGLFEVKEGGKYEWQATKNTDYTGKKKEKSNGSGTFTWKDKYILLNDGNFKEHLASGGEFASNEHGNHIWFANDVDYIVSCTFY